MNRVMYFVDPMGASGEPFRYHVDDLFADIIHHVSFDENGMIFMTKIETPHGTSYASVESDVWQKSRKQYHTERSVVVYT